MSKYGHCIQIAYTLLTNKIRRRWRYTDMLDEVHDASAPSGPLAGYRILDLTRVVMGLLATQVLADQGADVILVEAKGGDTNRDMGPGPHPELSGIALNLLRNKRSIDIDLKSADGVAALTSLVPTCDV